MELFNLLFTYTVFGIMGFFIAKKFRQPNNFVHWIVIILLILIFSFVGIQTRVISIFSFVIYLNSCIAGLGLGIITRFIYRQINRRSAIDVK